MIIYKITNKINGKTYIGYDTSMNFQRWKKHKKAATRDKPLVNEKNIYLYNAMRKYGIQNFIFKTIDNGRNIEELKEKEIFWIAHYNTFLGEGYNMTRGGDGGPGCTSFLKNATSERIEEYHKLLSRRNKETWDSLTKEELEKRGKMISKGVQAYWDSRTKEELEKWRKATSKSTQAYWNSLTEQELVERKKATFKGIQTYWSNVTKEERAERGKAISKGMQTHRASLTEQELEKWGKAISKGVQTHWDSLTREERKVRSKIMQIYWDSITKEEREERNSKIRKTYSVVSPDGIVIKVKNLLDFCRENNLSRHAMYKISKSGKLHKGWRCKIISD